MKSASALNLVLGAWLFSSAAMLGTTGLEAVNGRVCGLLIIVAAIGSLVSPWFLLGVTADGFALLNGMFVGAFVIILALARGLSAEPA